MEICGGLDWTVDLLTCFMATYVRTLKPQECNQLIKLLIKYLFIISKLKSMIIKRVCFKIKVRVKYVRKVDIEGNKMWLVWIKCCAVVKNYYHYYFTQIILTMSCFDKWMYIKWMLCVFDEGRLYKLWNLLNLNWMWLENQVHNHFVVAIFNIIQLMMITP